MARRRKGRDVDGILLLDKPVGRTSNSALQHVRRLFNARKAGHTGSLDPLASGLLPICFGEATKISSWLLHADKRYLVTARSGHETDTGDAEGQPTRYSETGVPPESQLREMLQDLVGAQQQVPPMYSALKKDGRPLYELARAGREVTREARSITVHAMHLLTRADDHLTLSVHVSRGTYIRTLVEDLARSWDGAAHVTMLRRTGVGTHDDAGMVDTAMLEAAAEHGPEALDAYLAPVSTALAHWRCVHLDAAQAAAVTNGPAVSADPADGQPGLVRIMDAVDGFLGIGEISCDGQLQPRRMFTRALR